MSKKPHLQAAPVTPPDPDTLHDPGQVVTVLRETSYSCVEYKLAFMTHAIESLAYGNWDSLDPDSDSDVTFGLATLMGELRTEMQDLNRLFGQQDTDAVLGRKRVCQ